MRLLALLASLELSTGVHGILDSLLHLNLRLKGLSAVFLCLCYHKIDHRRNHIPLHLNVNRDLRKHMQMGIDCCSYAEMYKGVVRKRGVGDLLDCYLAVES